MGDVELTMSDQATVAGELGEISDAVRHLADVIGQDFPLDKRETFAALIMMGLASRLQPLHVQNNKESVAAQASVVALGFRLADLAIAESDKAK